jgi:hypothetical protein
MFSKRKQNQDFIKCLLFQGGDEREEAKSTTRQSLLSNKQNKLKSNRKEINNAIKVKSTKTDFDLFFDQFDKNRNQMIKQKSKKEKQLKLDNNNTTSRINQVEQQQQQQQQHINETLSIQNNSNNINDKLALNKNKIDSDFDRFLFDLDFSSSKSKNIKKHTGPTASNSFNKVAKKNTPLIETSTKNESLFLASNNLNKQTKLNLKNADKQNENISFVRLLEDDDEKNALINFDSNNKKSISSTERKKNELSTSRHNKVVDYSDNQFGHEDHGFNESDPKLKGKLIQVFLIPKHKDSY